MFAVYKKGLQRTMEGCRAQGRVAEHKGGLQSTREGCRAQWRVTVDKGALPKENLSLACKFSEQHIETGISTIFQYFFFCLLLSDESVNCFPDSDICPNILIVIEPQ
ncbi:hypothetical protein OTU49_013199 [Cherax quadricarinatus]|uniref:Uncharacterized protein n=1 Tax=Cherax quadricarinatus TaxID=27406 RepID=A0AAW0YHB0_CHEQU